MGTLCILYDVNGNTTGESTTTYTTETQNGTTFDVRTSLTKAYSYDYTNMMSAANVSTSVDAKISGSSDPYTNSDSDSASDNYVYNGDGQRVKKITDGVTTKYYYTGSVVLYTADADNNKISGNIATPSGEIIATKDYANATNSDGSANTFANNYYFYHYDIRGSVTTLLKPDATFEQGYSYDEYGNTKVENSASLFHNEMSYTGAISDATTGLSYMNARYYNPATGTFTSQDTYYGSAYSPWTQHLYSYTGGNPVNYIDPTGHRFVEGTEIGGHVKSTNTKYDKKASEIIVENRQAIIDAANEYGVDPQIVASCIYTEQSLNVNWIDTATDWLGATGFIDMSVGLGQVRISTAKLLEKEGYVEETTSISFLTDTIKDSYAYNISMNLFDNQTNCLYVAAYIKYFEDRWSEEYPIISSDPAILATLYNQGEKNSPHSSPVANEFGDYAADNYDYMSYLLSWDNYFGN